MLGMDPAHPLGQLLIGLAAGQPRRSTLQPSVEARARYLQHPAQPLHAVERFVILNELKAVQGASTNYCSD